MADRFPSPFEIATPPGAEGWEELYAYSSLFSEGRREFEDSMFWFMDGVHSPEAVPPWDATFLEYAMASLSQYNTRHYLIPPALGIDFRILNGYVYLSPVPVADPAEIEARVPGVPRARRLLLRELGRLYDDVDGEDPGAGRRDRGRSQFEAAAGPRGHRRLTEGRGIGSGPADAAASTDKLLDLALKLWHHHFEFLNLGYAAYLDFFGFCKQRLPRRSPTRRSPRWSPGSRSTCSGPTRS